MFKAKHFKPRNVRDFMQSGQDIPNFYRRIEKTTKTNLINMIIITGKSQTGKSTLARKICERFDKDYITVFTVEGFLEVLEAARSDENSYTNKFLFFDEPELEVSKTEWWSNRNKVLTFILSSFGFLHLNIVMALPNIKGLSDVILTNINLRIDVKADYDEYKKEIVRRGLIKKAVWSDFKNKFIWITVEIHRIPVIEKDEKYELAKRNNFYNVQLPKWRKDINDEKDRKKWTRPTPTPTGFETF